ncbi:MAG: glutamine--fructose-6-phosphate transaminase (isomerizing) [Clostridiaceae bacterium]|nr:glutamine--fructose-6-phosphate transaminase (isomerizing) [Clostridiaceae bacterium]
MCGIVGYIGKKDAVQVLVDGLKKLEYRGYDSAGIAVYGGKNENKRNTCTGNNIVVVKCKGRLDSLQEKIKNSIIRGNMGIGHTRWATHGEPNDVNSHPHVSHSSKIAVVHNGIIENYTELKEFLESEGFEFVSDTDTEVIANLIEYFYKYYHKEEITNAVVNSLKLLEGTYALGIMCEDFPDRFIVARKGSPLVIGLGENENFAASDIPAILAHTRNTYILDDDEVALIKQDQVIVYDGFGNEVKKEVFKVDWDITATEKSGYEHFMIKEICEEPEALRNIINSRIKDGEIVAGDLSIIENEAARVNKIFIVACGTAYHAGLVGKQVIETLAKIPVEISIASEFRYQDPIISPGDLVIVISQSGETIYTLFALREAKRAGARVLSIVNTVGSSIARESDNVLYTLAEPEIAIASTKAYNNQLAALYIVALAFAMKRRTVNDRAALEIMEEIKRIPELVAEVLNHREEVQKFAARHYNSKSVFFIGRGLDYALSVEGSLKLKEISYIHSEAYAGGELKHGTIALIEEGTLVVACVTQNYLKDKIMSNIKEVKARGTLVLAVTQSRFTCEVSRTADIVITIPDMNQLLVPMVAITPLQLLAYYFAVQKGCDVDKPRNLAKSVTVE